MALGRQAFERRAWTEAFGQLSAADRAGAVLGVDDLDRLALAALMLGRTDEATSAWERAHRAALEDGDGPRAARIAFWLGMTLLDAGEHARGGGWLSRAGRILEEGGHDSVERGYLLVPVALQRLGAGDPVSAGELFGRALDIGERFRDPDLVTLGRLGSGQSTIMSGDPRQGVGYLDEAMVAVTAGEVSPIVVGIVYCAVIEACQGIFDLRRAQEWTAALSRWVEAQPDLVPYRGRCLVYRAELLRFHGDWGDAVEEARRAADALSRPPPGRPELGEALYEQAELHRLRGEFVPAEASYREASRRGRRPEPGFALLRLAQGDATAAAAMIRRALDEASGPPTRARLLGPFVEITLAAGDIGPARTAASELASVAEMLDAPLLRAVASAADGAVLVAEGDPRAALPVLRRAWQAWTELGAPHEAARTRVHIALACRAVGDDAAADLELDAALAAFRRLGAKLDVSRVERLVGRPVAPAGGLTAREVEVLRLVAAGRTNRAIAGELTISEKTVARHVSNIFTKLGLSSRAAATAYAYEHDLV